MNPQDELLGIIDTYLNNGMSEDERLAFEGKLAQDQTLASKVDEVKFANEAIYYGSLAELKNTIGKDIKNVKYKEPFNWKKASYISIASLALLSGITTYLITNNAKVDPGKIDNPSSIKETKEGSTQGNNTPVTQQEKVNKNKSYQESSVEKQKPTGLQADNVSTQKSISSTDNTLKNIKETKPVDPENKVHTNSADLTIKETITPAATDNKITCDKSFKINTEASCKQKETGSILIASDGDYSYTFQVDIRTVSGSKAAFPNMSAGVYDIVVTYGKECTYTKKVTVPEKWCAMNAAYSFNPDYNEKWIFNYETGASGTFTIFDKSGTDVYSNTFGSGNEEWNGNNRQGVPVPVGVYFAFINYSDGRKEKVELTIVR